MLRSTHIDKAKGNIVEAYRAGESTSSIAARYGVSYQTIRTRLHDWGITVRPAQQPKLKHVDAQKNDVIRLYESGYEVHQIANRLGVSHTSIWSRLKSWGIRIQSRQQRIADYQKSKIVELYSARHPISEISESLGIARHVIARKLREWSVPRVSPIYRTNPAERQQTADVSLDLFRRTITQMHLDGIECRDIARMLNARAIDVQAKIIEWGVS